MKTASSLPGSLSENRERGLGLIELLIGATVGLFLLSGYLYLYQSIISSSKHSLDMTRMDQQLRTVMDVMARNLRRAGYSGKAVGDGTDIPDYGAGNPFQTNGYQLELGGACSSGECNCVTFSYDADGDGAIDANTREIFGFRLSSGAIEMRLGGRGAPTCSSGIWQDITDSGIEVATLNIAYEYRDATIPTKPLALNLTDPTRNLTESPAGCPVITGVAEDCLQMRTMLVEIDAHLTADTTVSHSIRQKIGIGNARYCNDSGAPAC